MPQVPVQSPHIGLDVPGVQAPQDRQMGHEGAAMEGFGQTLMNDGVDLYTQINTAHAQDATENAKVQFKNDSDQRIRALKQASPDGYMYDQSGQPIYNDAEKKQQRTIQDEYQSWAQQRFQDDQDKMPNALAAHMYRQEASPFFSDQSRMLGTEVQSMRVNAFDVNQQQRLMDHGNAVVQNPGSLFLDPEDGRYKADLSDTYGHMNDMTKDITSQAGKLYDPTTAKEKLQKAYSNFGHQVAQGAYDSISMSRKQGDPYRAQKIQAWLGVLNGEDTVSRTRASLGLPTISSTMDPIQKSNEVHKLIDLMSGAQKADLSDFRESFKNLVSATEGRKDENGNVISSRDPVLEKQHQQMLGDIFRFMALGKDNGGVALEEGGAMLGKLWSARAVNDMLSDNGYKSMTPEQKIAYANRITSQVQNSVAGTVAMYGSNDPYVGQISKQEAYNTISEHVKNDLSAQKADLAGYFQKNMDQGLKWNALDFAHPSTLGNAQNTALLQSGIKDLRTFHQSATNGDPNFWKGAASEDHKKQMAAALTAPTVSTDDAVASIQGMQKGFGKEFPDLIDHMVKEGKLSSGWLLTKYNQSPMAIEAIRGGKYIDDNFVVVAKAHNADPKLLDGYVGSNMSDWIEANSKGYDAQKGEFAKQVTQVVKRYAEKLYTTNSGMGLDKAAEQAYKEFVGQYTVTKEFGGGFFGSAKGTYTIPTTVGGQKLSPTDHSNIEDNLHRILDTEEGIKGLKDVIAPTEANGMPATFRDKWEGFVAQSAHPSSVVYVNGVPGVNIWYKSGTNDTGPKDTLLYKKGPNGLPAPVFIPLDDLRRGAPQPAPDKSVPNPSPNRAPAGALDFLLDDDPMMRQAMGMPKKDTSVDNPSPYPIRTTPPDANGEYFQWHTDPASFFGGGKPDPEAAKKTKSRTAVPGAGAPDPMNLNKSMMNGPEVWQRGVRKGKA